MGHIPVDLPLKISMLLVSPLFHTLVCITSDEKALEYSRFYDPSAKYRLKRLRARIRKVQDTLGGWECKQGAYESIVG